MTILPLSHDAYQSDLFRKRGDTWRPLRFAARLTFLPGLVMLFFAMCLFLSYHSYVWHSRIFSLASMRMRGSLNVEHVSDAESVEVMHLEPKCRWEKYRDWPYVAQYGSLSPFRSKLLFVKTPKSSSSTAAHILQRYTTREHMIVAYPDFKHDEYTILNEQRGLVAKRNANVSEHDDVDAIVSHIVYNSSWVNGILGTDRPFRVTSVREPIARSWSMYLHGKERNIETFSFGANNPWKFAELVEEDGQLAYTAGFGNNLDPKNAAQVADHYDHIILSHRVVESFLTLSPKLGLRAEDLIMFSQKTDFHKQPLHVVTAKQKAEVDARLRKKLSHDKQLFDIAMRRLDAELSKIPAVIKQILRDLPQMKEEVKKECGKIDVEDNSCLEKGDIVWDGNGVCLARCISKWAEKNIRCQ